MVEDSSGESTPPCIYLISPGLLNRCRLYRRNERQAPEPCWDRSVFKHYGGDCPNHTGRRSFQVSTFHASPKMETSFTGSSEWKHHYYILETSRKHNGNFTGGVP